MITTSNSSFYEEERNAPDQLRILTIRLLFADPPGANVKRLRARVRYLALAQNPCYMPLCKRLVFNAANCNREVGRNLVVVGRGMTRNLLLRDRYLLILVNIGIHDRSYRDACVWTVPEGRYPGERTTLSSTNSSFTSQGDLCT